MISSSIKPFFRKDIAHSRGQALGDRKGNDVCEVGVPSDGDHNRPAKPIAFAIQRPHFPPLFRDRPEFIGKLYQGLRFRKSFIDDEDGETRAAADAGTASGTAFFVKPGELV